jgi:hypothetical protein
MRIFLPKIIFILCCLGAFMQVHSAYASVAERVERLRQQSRSAEHFEVVLSQNGERALSVIGQFDVGVDVAPETAGTDVLLHAVSNFVDENREVFAIYDKENLATLKVVNVDRAEPFTVLTFKQFIDDVLVLDSEMSATFWPDGSLHSVNSLPRSFVARRQAHLREAADVLEVAVENLRLEAFAEDGVESSSEEGVLHEFPTQDGYEISLLQAIDYATMRNVWVAKYNEKELRIDDERLEVARTIRHVDEINDTYSTCYVRHHEWPRDGNGRATTIVSPSGSVEGSRTCGADTLPWPFNVAYWHLKYEPYFTAHGIARIDDVDSSETEIVCSMPCQACFIASSGDYFEQQNAFYYVSNMRSRMLYTVWDRVAPNRDSNVDIHLDAASGPAYSDYFTSINMPPFWSNRADTLLHEYGHYVVWTYDDVSNQCTTTNQGDAIDETLADCFAMVAVANDGIINASYVTLQDWPLSQFPGAHRFNSAIFGYGSCGNDHHLVGLNFEQAFWELLWNKDMLQCGMDPTCWTNSDFSNQVWVGHSRNDVVRFMGGSVGYALKVLPYDLTYAQLIAQMYQKWLIDSGATDANRARAVFAHHGV